MGRDGVMGCRRGSSFLEGWGNGVLLTDMSNGVPLTDILGSPYEFLLAYPQPDSAELRRRLSELRALGVDQIYQVGEKQLGGFAILGMGYCGVVMVARWRGRLAALKVRRTNATQPSLTREANLLAIANEVQIGPRCLAHSPNFLVMDYLGGDPFLPWVVRVVDRGDRMLLQSVLIQLLEDGFRLDQLGLDHGNLRCITQHAIVQDNRAQILDFSTASRDRRPANVTALTQGLLISTAIANQVQQLFTVDKLGLIERLRNYKQRRDRDRFEQLVAFLFDQVFVGP
ncbi:MAG: serine/threonine protein kinase [Cyanobacteria bacterium P01_A01_bin.123]